MKHAPFNVCQRFSASSVKFCQSIKPAWRTLSWWPSCSRRWCRPLSLGHHFQPWPRNWSHPCCPGSLNHWNVRNKKCYFRTWTSRTPTVKRNVESVSRNNKERNPISRRKNYLIIQTYKLFLCLMFKSFTWITKCRRMKPLTRANVTSSDPSSLLFTPILKSFWYFLMSQKVIRRRIKVEVVISRLKILITCPYL